MSLSISRTASKRVAHAGPLENAKMFAEDGLIRHGVDFARILNFDGGEEVWSVGKDDEP
jgi:hypothetical protein